MPNSATTECARCQHTFLRYASACPECGWQRPPRSPLNRPMVVSLLGTAVAIGLSVAIASKYEELNDPAKQQAAANR